MRRLKNLNMWQRLGVVISVLWFLGAGLWQRNADVDRAGNAMGLVYRLCTEASAAKGEYNFDACSARSQSVFMDYLVGSWGNVAIAAIGPIIVGWILAYIVLATVRWVLAGRSSNT